jgi:hypothetical protein
VTAELEPVVFVDRRTVERTKDGYVVTEHWTDDTETQRVMGPRETVAWLNNQGRAR